MSYAHALKVLCLSFWTPPIIRPQSILIGKMIPEWIRQGVEPVIVTYDVCGHWDIGVPIYTVPVFKADGRGALLRNVLEWRYYRRIFSMVKPAVERHRPDLVFSFANPQASNILGAMVKQKLGVPFVSHFSDPWIDSPYHHVVSWFGRKKALRLESYIMRQSGAVIFTNESAKKLVMRKYDPALLERAHVMPHSYDPKDYPEAAKSSGKFVMSYIGAFYRERNPEPFFEALKRVLASDHTLPDRLTLRLVGAASDYTDYKMGDIQKMIERYGLSLIVELVGMVKYQESLAEMKRSDCLVVIDANFAGSPFFPSKVVDYAASGTPIVGITPSGSPTARFLAGLGYRSFSYEEIEGLTAYLKDFIQGKIKPTLNMAYLKDFSVEATTAKLISIFESVLTKRS